MQNAQQLARRFREVHLDGKLIAQTNYKDQLSQISWEQAVQQVGTLNTIAQLTYHVNYYIGGLLNVFAGGDLEIRDKYSFDLPPIRSEEDWNMLLNEFWTNAEKFAQYIEQMTDEKLAAVFVDEKYGNYYKNILDIIEHGYYHLGQISLIRKLLGESVK